MTTRLTVYGVPGQEQSFLPKTPLTPTATQITSLSVLGTPGPLHRFMPKIPNDGKADRFHDLPWLEKQLYDEDEIILMAAALFMEMME